MNDIEYEYEIENVENGMFIIIGKRATGKSTIVKDIVSKYFANTSNTKKIVISPTEKITKFYESFIEKEFIHYYYYNSILDNVLNNDDNSVIIFDDCLITHQWTQDEAIIKLFNNNHNNKITSIFTFAYASTIPKTLIDCVDYVFLLKEESISNKKRLYEHYGHYIFDSYAEFDKVFLEITQKEDHNCMVIDIKEHDYYEYKAVL